MSALKHPATLNVLRQYSQACSILRTTSRASNPAWYQDALELDHQLHIRVDGPQARAFYFDRPRNQWTGGPVLTPEILLDPERLAPVVTEILHSARSSGAGALGVVLHIADEFATAELKPELDNPAALPELKETACHDPAAVVADASILADQSSWRVIPYPATCSEAIATTVAVSRQYANLINKLRAAGEAANFPVITRALSAPLVALVGLSEVLAPTPGRPFVTILQYPWFTTLAFFNDHGDLRLIRALQHRGVARAPNLRHTLATTNASLEFTDPDLFVVPLGEEVDATLESSLRVTFAQSRVETAALPAAQGLPAWCAEPGVASNSNPPSESAISSHTFTVLRDEKWASQDFLPTPKEIGQIYPSKAEMKLLKLLRFARVAVVAVTLICLAALAFGVLGIVRKPEWSFDPTQANMVRVRLAKLGAEQQKIEHWGNLLEDRSKAWVAMESLAIMVTGNNGILVKSYAHSVKPENTPGQARVGFTKEWRITGFARDEAIEFLNQLNTREGINSHFAKVAQHTGAQAFSPTEGNRNIAVNVRTQENNSFKPIPLDEAVHQDESTYPFSFELTITQRFESTDPMAFMAPKAP